MRTWTLWPGFLSLGNAESLWSASSPPALFSEQVALAGALLWIGQSVHFLQAADYKIYFDCQVAGWSTSGLWQGKDDFSPKLRALDQYIQGLTLHQVYYEHVRSHCGHPWNELVDAAAKHAAIFPSSLPGPPRSNCEAFLRLDMAWMATVAQWGPTEAINSRAGRWLVVPPKTGPAGSPLDGRSLIPLTQCNPDKASGGTFNIQCASINVQGLRAKSKFLADQLEHRNYNLVFIQETKVDGGMWTPGAYLRFATKAEKHWGVAIWIHQQLGLMDINGSPLCLEESDVSIKEQSPRLLILEVIKGGIRCILFSAHIPHQGKGDERTAFLAELERHLCQLGHADLVVGGMDANGRTPTNQAPVTGSLECGDADEAGHQLVEVLNTTGLWLPATYAEIHCGPSETFCHANGQLHRIDYLALGGNAWFLQARSYVDQEIDLAATRDDHYVVALSMTGQTWHSPATAKLWRPRYDREKMATPEGRRIIKEALEAYQAPPWWVHVDTHCQHLQDYVCRVLEDNFPPPKTARSSYIPVEVWQWRDKKLALKKKTSHRKPIWAQALATAFFQWSHGFHGLVEELLQKDGVLYQLAASAIGYATHRIKQAINQGKAQYLRTIIAEGPQSATNILQRAKRHGIGGRKKTQASRPLPLLLDPQGKPARNQDDHDRIWLNHFGDQEYGQILEPQQFLRLRDVATTFEEGVTWSLEDLPTVGEIEGLCRTAPRNKAMGLDGIPGELLNANPPAAAMALMPLFLKAASGLQQPVQWRGGVIYSAWKQAGEISRPDSHRSLFISSVVGKAFHRWLRNKTKDQLQSELHPLHLGSKVNAPISFASLYVFARFRHCRDRGRSVGMIFLDTTAAYYRVLRETVVGDINYDDTIVWLMKRFNLGPEEMEGPWNVIKSGGIMEEAGISGALRAMMKDVHHRTWCVTKHTNGSRLAMTHAGSRPGESLADAIFAYLYSRVLGRIWEAARGEEIISATTVSMEDGIFGVPGSGDEESLRDVTWADDTAMPFDDVDPDRCLRKGKRLASLTIGICQEFGLQPNLKRGKTTVVLALQGKGVQKAKATHFGHGRTTLPLADLQVEVPVAPQYVHLGGVLDARVSMKPEMRRRLSMASAAMDSGKKLLFQNKQIPLETRAQLFEMSILSTLFNLPIWIPEGPAWKSLSQGYTRILRQLLSPRYPGDRIFTIPAPFVHIATNRWKLEYHAVKSRMTTLIAIVKNGPAVLWGVLQDEQRWLAVVRQDLALIKTYHPELPAVEVAAWPTWWHLLHDQPGQFKYKVKKSLQGEHDKQCGHDAMVVAMWQIHRQLVAKLPGTMKEATTWGCRGCAKTFRSKGGLGAHFYKTHGRVAAHRKCVTGTLCHACGRQFWSTERLEIHLRASKQCVNMLWRSGKTAAAVLPGQGSRIHRKRAVDEFSLAPSCQEQEPGEGDDGHVWPEVQKQASRAVSETLLESSFWPDEVVIRDALLATLGQHPLYFEEEREILEQTLEDASVLVAAAESPWDEDSSRKLMAALQEPDEWHHQITTVREESEAMDLSLTSFQERWSSIDWGPLLALCRDECGTPEPFLISLGPNWEASKMRPIVESARSKPRLTTRFVSFPERLGNCGSRFVKEESVQSRHRLVSGQVLGGECSEVSRQMQLN